MQMPCSLFTQRFFGRWVPVLLILALSGLSTGPVAASPVPAVTATSPAAGSTAVSADTTITATFSEPLEPATVTPGSFVLSQEVKIRAIAAGNGYTVVLRDNGTVTSWGYNGFGQTSVPTGLVGVTAISSGYSHTLALKNDRTVVAWGENVSGETTVPTGLAEVTALAAGAYHSLALKNDGTVTAWGYNYQGQTTVPGDLTGAIGVAAGNYHSLALKSDGTVTAWGDNRYGQVSVPAGLSGVIAVAAGNNFSLALKNDGTVVAWGANDKGQTSVPPGLAGVVAIATKLDYAIALKKDGTVVAWGDNSQGSTNVPAGLSGVTAIAAGFYHGMALKNDGTLVFWGSNESSQNNLPVPVNGVTAVAAGYHHTVVLKGDGKLFAWGYNGGGQTVIPAGLSEVTAVAAGSIHNLALNAAGYVTAWGGNFDGQTAVPAGLTGVTAIAAGDYHSVALKSNGTVVAWGRNDWGQSTVPGGLTNVTKIAAGTSHTLALKQDGTVTAWGSNFYNQVTIPIGLTGVISIAAAGNHSLALKNDGTVTAWGENTKGQSTVPSGLSGVIAIAASGSHSAALKSDGSVVAWGDNTYGQSTVPAGLDRVVGIAAGNNFTMAVKNDGTLVGWGYNIYGQTIPPQDPYGQEIAAEVSYSTGSDSATITPAAALPAAATLTATVTTGVSSLDGTHPAADYSWSLTTADPTPPVTTASPAGGTYTSAQNVTLTANEPATIYYTTNGATPTTSSPVYSGPIPLSFTTTLKFFARDTAGNSEVAQTATYTIVADTTPPATTASPAGGTYSTAQSVTLTANEPATIYYTTNGLAPTTSSPVYSGPIPLSVTTTLKFFARDTAGNSETPKSSTYTIVADTTSPVTTPSPAGGTYTSTLNVTLTANEPATIYYTTNGATPTTSSPVYSGPLPIPATTTLKFFARDTAGNSETVKTATYTLNLDTTPPVTTASPPGGTYTSALNVTLTANEPATIYYTTNGATPTTSSPVYSGPLPIPATTTLKFFARDTAGNSETVKTTTYTLNLDTTPPVTTASPAGGTYSAAQTVTLTANEPATIYYTTNGATPTTTSTVYSGPLPIPATSVLKFFARDTAGNNEAVRTESYTIKQNQTITFGPLPVKTYGDQSFVLSATASSGLAVSFTSSNTSVATVSGTTLTIVGAGSAVITASQGGNGNYNAAPVVTRTLTVNKATLTVQAANATRAYGAENPVFSATYSGFVNGDTQAVLSGSPGLSTVATASSPVGTYPITAAAGTLASPNYSFSFANGTLTVNKAAATVTLGSLSTTYDGTPKGATATTIPAGLAVTLTYNGAETAPTAVGSYTVVGTVSDPNYQGSATGTMTIARGSQTITFGVLPAKTYGDPSFALGATASSGLAISYTSSNPAVATVSGTAVTIIGAGTTTITASQVGDGNYTPATDVAQTLTVNKATATVTLGSLSTTYDGTPKGATATTIPVGLTVTLTYNGAETAPTVVGSYTVVGSVSDPNYQGNATGTMTIAKGSQTITFGVLPAKTYGDPTFALSGTAGSGLPVSYTSSNPAVATVSGTTVTIVGAGTATITASQGGDGNYNAAPEVAQILTVNKAAATVTLGSLSTTYDGTPKTATATTVPSGLGVTLTYNGLTTAPTVVGSYTVVGSVSDPNYQGSATGTLAIAKGNQTITFAALPVKTYGDPAFTLTATASSGLAATYTSSNAAVATVSGSTVTIVGAGSATITATQGGDANYNAAPAVTQTLTVNKAVATITFGVLSFTYDNVPRPVTVTTAPVGLAVTITYDGTATPPTEVGKYTVVATVNDANYQGSATAIEEISKKSQTITFDPLPVKTYGDAPFTFTASASSNLNLSFDYDTTIATITKQGQKYLITIVGAGTTVITATQAGNRNYSDAPPVSQTLIVNKAAATVTLGSLGAIYDGSAKVATATTNPAGLSVAFTYNGSATPPTAAGSYSVIGTINNANYQGSASGTLVIAKASQTITFGALQPAPYGTAPFTPGATASSGLAIGYTSSNPAVATVSGTTVTIVGTGTTTITANQGGDGNYTAASAVPQTLTVSKGAATVTLGNLTTTYNGTPRAATATTVPSGLPITLTYNGSTTAPVAVGTYTVTASVADPNYEGTAAGTLTIDRGAQVITFGALTPRTFGDSAYNLAATADSGLAISYTSSNPAVATISGTTVTVVGAGTTIITASQGGDGNYNAATAVPQALTVSKGTATVTLGGLTTTYNGTQQAATSATVPGGLPVTLTYNGSSTAPTAAGTYTVTATVTSPNYQGGTTGTLTIAKGAQTISFGSLPAKTVGNAPFTLTATATSGLAVSYTSSNTSVATVSGNTVTIVGAGTTTITASQGGNGNYDAAPAIAQTLAVNAAPAGTGKTAVTIGTTTSYYDTVTATLAAIPAGTTTTIRLQTMTFAEAVNINVSGATISILGGYDSGFTSATGMTTIQGNLVITAGTLVVDKLTIM